MPRFGGGSPADKHEHQHDSPTSESGLMRMLRGGFGNDAVLKDIPRVLKNRLTVPGDNVEVGRRRAPMTSMSSD
jgi:hypothetical protein